MLTGSNEKMDLMFKVFANTKIGDLIVERVDDENDNPCVEISANHKRGKVTAKLGVRSSEERDLIFENMGEDAAVGIVSVTIDKFEEDFS